MKIILGIKPLSVNAAYQGRRFKTKECACLNNSGGVFTPITNAEVDKLIKKNKENV